MGSRGSAKDLALLHLLRRHAFMLCIHSVFSSKLEANVMYMSAVVLKAGCGHIYIYIYSTGMQICTGVYVGIPDGKHALIGLAQPHFQTPGMSS